MPSLRIPAPIAGINRFLGYESQEPIAAYDLVNIWPTETQSGRKLIATRPGIVASMSPGSNINFLTRINGNTAGKPLQSMICARNGQVYWWDGSSWVAATGTGAASVETDRPIFGKAFLLQAVIGDPGAALAPLLFDYPTATVVRLVATQGTAPVGCNIFTVFLGALCAAGDPANAQVLFMSRQGDLLDWDYGVALEDEGGAFFTAGESEGLINGPITALMPHGDDMLVISSLEGLTVLRGHPRQGGLIESLQTGVYILGQGAWTKGPDDTAYFLTSRGLMSLAPDSKAVPALISRSKVPNELVGVSYDHENTAVSLEYDSRFNGIRIEIRQTDVTEAQSWWYDLDVGGFARNEVEFSATHLVEFPPYITENKSGVLHIGEGYGGLGRMDRFDTTESFYSRVISNATPVVEDQKQKAIVRHVSLVLGGDTVAGDGVVSLAMGRDSEDAVTRLRSGTPQYRTALSTIINNDGYIYPLISGASFAYMIEQSSGRYSLELVDLDSTPSGRNRMPLVPRIATEAGDDTVVVFTPAEWLGYVQTTYPASTGTLTGYTHFFDLSAVTAADWWANVRPSGADIRVTDGADNVLPSDLIYFDPDAQTGLIAFKQTPSTSTTSTIRLWVGNEFALFPTGSSSGFNTYDANWIGFWPDGGGVDRTRNRNNFTLYNGAEAGNTSGPIGSLATSYNDADSHYGVATSVFPNPETGYPLTMVGYATNANASSTGPQGTILSLENITEDPTVALRDSFQLREISDASPDSWRASSRIIRETGSSESATTLNSLGITTNGNLYAGIQTSPTSRAALINGGNKVTQTDPMSISSPLQQISIGAVSKPLATPTDHYDGDLSLVSLHDVVRPDEWISRFYDMLTQGTYYSTVGAWVEP